MAIRYAPCKGDVAWRRHLLGESPIWSCWRSAAENLFCMRTWTNERKEFFFWWCELYVTVAGGGMGGESHEYHRVRDAEEAAKRTITDALLETKAATSLGLDAGAEAIAHKALESLFDTTDLAITTLCEAEFDAAKAKLKAQANWHATKLETSRVAAATRLEHKVIEANADFQAQLDAKLRALASVNGSSLESELMQRIEEQNAELKRLKGCDEQLSETRAQLDATEAELSATSRGLASLTEDVRVCTGVMERALKKDLDAELTRAAQGAIRDQVLEVIDTYKKAGGKAVEQAAALRAEGDALATKLEESETANAAGLAELATVRAQLEQCRSAEAEHQQRTEEAERETAVTHEKLAKAGEEVEALRETAEKQRNVAEAAQAAQAEAEAATERVRSEADAAIERAQAEAEARVAGDMEGTQSRVAEMEAALAEATEKAALAAEEAASQTAAREAAEANAAAEAQATAEAHQQVAAAEARAIAAAEARAQAQAGKEAAERLLAEEMTRAEEAARAATETEERLSAEVHAGVEAATTLRARLAEASLVEEDLRTQQSWQLAKAAEQQAKLAEQAEQQAQASAARLSLPRIQPRPSAARQAAPRYPRIHPPAQPSALRHHPNAPAQAALAAEAQAELAHKEEALAHSQAELGRAKAQIAALRQQVPRAHGLLCVRRVW